MAATLNTGTAAKHVGELVDITFSDGTGERGTLAAVDGDTLEFDKQYDRGGRTHVFTARYTLVGDEDTPAVTGIEPVAAQTETLF